MKDYTTIAKQKDGRYEIIRDLRDSVSEDEIRKQLSSLEHEKEIALDTLESVEIRIKLIKDALEHGKASADTTMAGLKLQY